MRGYGKVNWFNLYYERRERKDATHLIEKGKHWPGGIIKILTEKKRTQGAGGKEVDRLYRRGEGNSVSSGGGVMDG